MLVRTHGGVICITLILCMLSAARADVPWQDCALFSEDASLETGSSPYVGPWGTSVPSELRTSVRQLYAAGKLKIGDNPVLSQCVNLTVPLFWENPNAGNITVFVQRLFIGKPGKGQMWFLNGGPGGSGGDMLSGAVVGLLTLNGALDIYLPDHRGTGKSSPMNCPTYNMTACAAYVNATFGDNAHGYTPTEAARDVAFAIGQTRQAAEPVYVYGVSYGTYWANRFMMILSEPFFDKSSQPNAMVLDGVCPPDMCRMDSYDVHGNRVLLDLMTHCQRDSFCSSQFTALFGELRNKPGWEAAAKVASFGMAENAGSNGDADPLRFLFAVRQLLEGGDSQCAAALNLRLWPTNTLYNLITDFAKRPIFPAFLFRLARCNADDIKALKAFFGLPPVGAAAARSSRLGFSEGLSANIISSEMYTGLTSPATTCDGLNTLSQSDYVATFEPGQICQYRQVWNKYTPDSYLNEFASNVSFPVLLLNGDLDPATPFYWAEHAITKYQQSQAYPNQFQLIVVPLSAHGTAFQSPTISQPTNATHIGTCGFQMTTSFFLSPNHVPDTSCLSDLLQIDWQGVSPDTQRVSQNYFNTPNLWGL